jgi:NAD kinase
MVKLKIGIAAKESKIQWDMHRLVLSWDEVVKLYEKQRKDIDKIISSHERQKRSIESIISRCPSAQMIDMRLISFGEKIKPELDMLIAIGGDNFFQLCTHHFQDAYLVGVNSDSETSHGALLNYSYDTLLPKLDNILKGNFRTENWTRVATELNGKRVEDATCTVSLSIKATDMISRYLLTLWSNSVEGGGAISEEQKATGLLVVTGAGSGDGAWYRSAGLYLPLVKSGVYKISTKEFPKDSGRIMTLTREPFNAEYCQYRLLNRTIWPDGGASLIYWANDPSELSVDSINRYKVKDGDRLTFRVSEKTIKVVARD